MQEGAAERHGIPPGGAVAIGFRQATGLVQEGEQQVPGIVRRYDAHEGRHVENLGIAALDHLFRRAGLAADYVAGDSVASRDRTPKRPRKVRNASGPSVIAIFAMTMFEE